MDEGETIKRKPAARKSRGALFAALVAAAAVLTILFRAGAHKGAENAKKMDELAGRVAVLVERGENIPRMLRDRDEDTLTEAVVELQGLYGRTLQLLGEIDALEHPAYAPLGRGTFRRRKLLAEDLCRAAGNYLYAMAGAIHLRIVGVTEEGFEQKAFADRMLAEYKKLRGGYSAGAVPPGYGAAPPPPAGNARYVFVILVDALRADHLRCYGYGRPTTPNIDRLAAQGLLFSNAFSQAPYTDTSVASIFTALYPKAHKMNRSTDWLWELSLIGRFRKAGYATAGFSANTLISREYHFDNGFEHFEEIPYGRATLLFGQTERWLERNRAASRRIFAYIHLIDPHDLYFAPIPFNDMYDKGYEQKFTPSRLRRNLENAFGTACKASPECCYDPYRLHTDDPNRLLACLSLIPSVGGAVTGRDIRNFVSRYDGEITYADSEIGRFVKYLEKTGMLPKSIIVILADHGESFLDHNRLMHGRSLYDSQIHVPLIFWRGRDNFGGRRVDDQVELIDTLPTLLAMSGIGIPGGLHGRNLLGREKPKQPDRVYSLLWNRLDITTGASLELTAAREPEFKYIRAARATDSVFSGDEFYRIVSDPAELRDARGEYRPEFNRLVKDLVDWNITTDTKPPRPLRKGIDATKLKKLRDLGYVK